jgi:hypothetical protein
VATHNLADLSWLLTPRHARSTARRRHNHSSRCHGDHGLPGRMVDLLHYHRCLVRQVRAAEATGRFNHQLQACLRPSVLVVDEVGNLPLDRPKPTWSSSSSLAATNAAP